MKKILFLSICYVLVMAKAAAQQIPLYSEMYFLRMLYNPALTAYNGNTDIYGFFRDQWTGIPGHPTTAGALGEMSLWDDRIGVGFHVYEDNTSIIHRLDAQLYYAQKVTVAKDHVISLGVSGGIMNTYIDFANAIAADPNDPTLLANSKGGIAFDMNVGLAYQWKRKLTIGFSVPQILNTSANISTETNTAIYQMQREYIGSASYEFSFANEKYNVEPCVMITKGAGTPVQVDGNVTFNYKRILYLGVGYRQDYGFSAMAAVKIDKAVTIGYAFDAAVMPGANFSETKGTHEIILGISFDRWMKKKGNREERNDVQPQIDSLKADNQDIHNTLDSLEQLIDSLVQNTDSLRQTIDSVQQNVDSIMQSVDSLMQLPPPSPSPSGGEAPPGGAGSNYETRHIQEQELRNESRIMEMQQKLDSFENAGASYQKAISHQPIENFPSTVNKYTKTTKGTVYRLNNVNFDRNSSYLPHSAYAELNKVVSFLENNPTMHIRINGHTDNTASDKYDQWLSDRRARRVYDYLVEKGISSNRMQYIGFGKRMPIADNGNEAGRAKNRRVEIQILK